MDRSCRQVKKTCRGAQKEGTDFHTGMSRDGTGRLQIRQHLQRKKAWKDKKKNAEGAKRVPPGRGRNTM